MKTSYLLANRITKIALLPCFAVLVGCGGPYDASLKGTVSLDGQPLSAGTVTLKPNTTEGAAAYGRVDESGYYSVQTGREFGLNAGEYSITVVAREKPDSLYGKDGGPPQAGELITPEWYRSTNTSGLVVTVEPGGNRHDIDLSSEPPAGWQERGKKSQRRRR